MLSLANRRLKTPNKKSFLILNFQLVLSSVAWSCRATQWNPSFTWSSYIQFHSKDNDIEDKSDFNFEQLLLCLLPNQSLSWS